ncbi:dTMP kinase [Candidatus Nitrospira allomarina]|uniref:Thymidylate kinase n=1 Tax=Candidatus Nitrospira allomarina TaxID=3020900 RepID=A0AA96GJ45_9BACT|nr:dTMP kinase [Candidatus Nitrospira allomarina]WNM59898.1 dTMP kinase [Candidatus Nitrospira allomarina]
MKPRNYATGKQGLSSGLFITFEGTEGSGKTTQCHRLARALRAQGYQVLETREPGGTPLSEAIRRLLLSHSHTKSNKEIITPECETALIFAARSQHVAHVIRPALLKGMIVLCDRFFDSTLAYQGYGRHRDITFLKHFHQFATEGLTPHLTFLLDLPTQEGLTRRQQARHQNRLDQESLDFHQRVRRGFIALAKQHPQRIQKLDARQSPEILNTLITSMMARLIQSLPSTCLAHVTPQPRRIIKRVQKKGTPQHGVSRSRRASTPN